MYHYFKNFSFSIILISILAVGVKAAGKPKVETATIQTSAICEECKNRIEKALVSTKGIESANLNLNNKKVKVKYEADKISVEQIRTVIANTGYDADDVKHNPEAFNSLPKCCQKADGTCGKGK
jgi:mercuric ion binding protein